MTKLIIYDTTLRDGLQAQGANMSLADKVKTFGDLDNLGVPFIEVCWPASPREDPLIFEKCRAVRKQAKIVAFGSTSMKNNPEEDANLASILNSKADYACIFGKTWIKHVHLQLKINEKENLERIRNSILFLKENGMPVIYDAEHFFDGYKDNKEYALSTLYEAAKAGAEYLVLCDTNGGILPHEALEIIKEVKEKLKNERIATLLGTHFHNDSGLAIANALYTADEVSMVQGTVNGTGERVGNLNWAAFAANWKYKMGRRLDIKWDNLSKVNREAFKRAGLDMPENLPYVGKNAFAHKGGVHIDAISKGASYEHINPEIFGGSRVLLLTTQGGRGSILKVSKEFGYNFDKKDSAFIRKSEELFKKLKDIEDKGYRIEALPAEHFLLIEEHFGKLKDFFKLGEIEIKTQFDDKKEESSALIECKISGKLLRGNLSICGGPIEAIYRKLGEMLGDYYPSIKELKIEDYHVSLARHEGARSPVRTAIGFCDGESFTTVGVSDNIIRSAAEAIEKGFRYYLNRKSQNIKGGDKT